MATYNHRVSYNGSQIATESGRSTMPTITYNGATRKTEFIGDCTINCSGKYMATNVTVGGKTLLCANKIMASNISVYAYGVVGAKPSSTASRTYNGGSQDNGYTTPSYVTMTGNRSGTNANTYVAYYTPQENYYWSDGTRDTVSITMTISPLSISDATVNLGSGLTYNGGSQTQSVSSVTKNGLSATYNVSGNTGTNAGGYTLTCTGTGNYTGSVQKSWSIATRSISGAYVSLGSGLTYNGGSQTQSVSSVTISGLSATFSVGGNTQTNAGSYTLTCYGTGNFSGSQDCGWSIGRRNIDTFTIGGGSRTFDGSWQGPYVASCSGAGLSATYSTSGDWSKYDAGSYTAWVTGTGNFQGSLSASWSIGTRTLTGFSLNTTSTRYNGGSQTVYVSSVTASGLNATYSTSGSYSGTNVYTYRAWVTGTGNYSGSLYVDWSITAMPIDTFTISGDGQWYDGGTKSISAYTVSGGGLSATYGTYGDWSGTSGGYYTAYVYGTGNFSGTISKTWYIQYVWYRYYSVLSYSTAWHDLGVQPNDYTELRTYIGANKYYGYRATYYSFNTSTGKIAQSGGYIDQNPPKDIATTYPSTNMNYAFGLPKDDNSNSWDEMYHGNQSCKWQYVNTSYRAIRAWNIAEYYRTADYCTVTGTYSRGDYITAVGNVTSSTAYPSNGRASDGYWYVQTW